MAGIPASALRERSRHQHIQLVDETPHRTLLPRSRMTIDTDRAESSSLGKVQRQTAFPPPSSVCHHFCRAPSSDGAPFSQNVLTSAIARIAAHANQHGWPSRFAFVGLDCGPHKDTTNCSQSSSLAQFLENRGRPPPWPPLNGRSLRRITLRPRSSPRARPFSFWWFAGHGAPPRPPPPAPDIIPANRGPNPTAPASSSVVIPGLDPGTQREAQPPHIPAGWPGLRPAMTAEGCEA